MLNTIPAQEIKRRGIAAVDDLIVKGPVHVIRNNKPEYVIMSQQRYADLLKAETEGYEARVLASLEDWRAGRVWRGTAEELIAQLNLEA